MSQLCAPVEHSLMSVQATPEAPVHPPVHAEHVKLPAVFEQVEP